MPNLSVPVRVSPGTLRQCLACISHTCRELLAGCFNRAPSPPRLAVGEKVAKRDEGALTFRERCLASRITPPETSCHPIARHASSAFGTFSPRKARGEKALDAKESLKSVRNAG